MLLVLSFSMINFEKKGVNNKPLNVSFDVYILNNEISKGEIYSSFLRANQIWNNYNISIQINEIKNIYKNISDDEKREIFESKDNNLVNLMINHLLENSTNLSIIFMSNKNSSGEGRGCLSEKCTALVVDSDEKNFLSWNLAHEIGHTLHAKSYCWKLNLMTELCNYKNPFVKSLQGLSYLRKTLKPDFLNQFQVDTIIHRVSHLSPKNI
jgi:hypothetical protein